MTATDNDAGLAVWEGMSESLRSADAQIQPGRMMSSPALTFEGKVFAFYSRRFGGLGVRLGRETDPSAFGASKWEVLSPFKTKPPMADWFMVGGEDRVIWSNLARAALERMRAARTT